MDFLKEITTHSPFPAGGAAATYTLSLAVGLIYKTLLLEIRRESRPEIEGNLRVAQKEIERLMGDVQRLMTQDPDAHSRFAQSLRGEDQSEMKRQFSHLLDVNIKVLEKSGAAFEWIRQLSPMVPEQMNTHLRVACELTMGAVNATVHVAKANIQSVKAEKKRENYLLRLDELHEAYRGKYKSAS